MYLVDTNIWLEYLLDQKKASEAEEFFRRIDDGLIYISDFSLFSIGIITQKYNKIKIFEKFINDIFNIGEVNFVRLEISDLNKLTQCISNLNLDFDDAYQFTCAETFGLELISYDKDFDKATVKRKTPAQIIKIT
jgi:predicted nucleic acid-binding protein